jgi:uncharacterized cupin superfamily protein
LPVAQYSIVRSADAFWAPAGPMQLTSADLGEQLGASKASARLWRLQPQQAGPNYIRSSEEEVYMLLAGEGKLRVDGEVVTVGQPLDGVLVQPGAARQIFNDTTGDVLWLVIGSGGRDVDVSYADDPRRLPPELGGGLLEPPQQAGPQP